MVALLAFVFVGKCTRFSILYSLSRKMGYSCCSCPILVSLSRNMDSGCSLDPSASSLVLSGYGCCLDFLMTLCLSRKRDSEGS